MRVVVVTGGGTGIGRAIARAFALDGDAVHIVGRREGPLIDAASAINAEAGREAVHPHPADATDIDQVGSLAAELSSVDVIVNNAGGASGRDDDSVVAIVEQAERDFRNSCLAALVVTEVLADRLADGGRVVNITSIAALRGGGTAYAPAKAAVIGLTYSLATELGPRGITVNAVAPGYVTGTEFFADDMTPERHERLVDQTLTGRPSSPEDVAAAVKYLASPEAAQITGQVLQVNGGALFGRG